MLYATIIRICFNSADKYSRLVSSKETIKNFVGSAVKFLKDRRFDGLDVDWEYPRNETDKLGFTTLMYDLKKAFKSEGFLLSTVNLSSQLESGPKLVYTYIL